MLRWICGYTRNDTVRNDTIQEKVGVTPIKNKNNIRKIGRDRN